MEVDASSDTPADAGDDRVPQAVRALRDAAISMDLLDQVAATRLGIGRSDLRCLDVQAVRQTV